MIPEECEPSITADGPSGEAARVRRRVGAAGPRFVCVSGLGGTVDEWGGIAPALAARGEVVALAIPRRAHRSQGPLDDSLRAGARRLEQELAPSRGGLVLIGHSMGAVVAMLTAARQSDRVVHALLLTAPFVPVGRNGRSTLATAADYARHRALFVAATARGRSRRQPGSLTPAARVAGLRSLARYGLRPSAFHARADLVRSPVLVVHGRNDHHVPPAFASAAVQRHAAWELRLLDGAGHFPHRDDPRAWLDAVEPWLDRILT